MSSFRSHFRFQQTEKCLYLQALIAGGDFMVVGENPDQLVINGCWWGDFSFIL